MYFHYKIIIILISKWLLTKILGLLMKRSIENMGKPWYYAYSSVYYKHNEPSMKPVRSNAAEIQLVTENVLRVPLQKCWSPFYTTCTRCTDETTTRATSSRYSERWAHYQLTEHSTYRCQFLERILKIHWLGGGIFMISLFQKIKIFIRNYSDQLHYILKNPWKYKLISTYYL